MERWNPDDETPTAVEAPADVWVAWLNRAPLYDVTPPPPTRRGLTGVAIGLGLAGFWMGAIALGWTLLG